MLLVVRLAVVVVAIVVVAVPVRFAMVACECARGHSVFSTRLVGGHVDEQWAYTRECRRPCHCCHSPFFGIFVALILALLSTVANRR